MSILSLSILLGLIGVNFVEPIESVRLEIKENQFKLLSITGNGIWRWKSNFVPVKFDLTETLGYTDWEAFLRDFTYFETNGYSVDFYRFDYEGVHIVKENIKVAPFRLNQTSQFDWDIEIYDRYTNPKHGTMVYEFTHDDNQYAPLIFDETISYSLTFFQCQISFLMQKYVKNDHLMLRAAYKVRMDTAGSSTGAFANVTFGDYADFF